jgi:hypothetical protein
MKVAIPPVLILSIPTTVDIFFRYVDRHNRPSQSHRTHLVKSHPAGWDFGTGTSLTSQSHRTHLVNSHIASRLD